MKSAVLIMGKCFSLCGTRYKKVYDFVYLYIIYLDIVMYTHREIMWVGYVIFHQFIYICKYVSYQSFKSAWTCNIWTRSSDDWWCVSLVTDQYELPMGQQCCRWYMVLYGCAMTTDCWGSLQGFVIELWMDMVAQHCLLGKFCKVVWK